MPKINASQVAKKPSTTGPNDSDSDSGGEDAPPANPPRVSQDKGNAVAPQIKLGAVTHQVADATRVSLTSSQRAEQAARGRMDLAFKTIAQKLAKIHAASLDPKSVYKSKELMAHFREAAKHVTSREDKSRLNSLCIKALSPQYDRHRVNIDERTELLSIASHLDAYATPNRRAALLKNCLASDVSDMSDAAFKTLHLLLKGLSSQCRLSEEDFEAAAAHIEVCRTAALAQVSKSAEFPPILRLLSRNLELLHCAHRA